MTLRKPYDREIASTISGAATSGPMDSQSLDLCVTAQIFILRLDMVSQAPKLNRFEKYKAEKDGLEVKHQLDHFAQIGWEGIDADDRNRLKWLGIFFRPVTPGKFMLRMRLPNGTMNAEQMRSLAEMVQRYGEDGSADITTRQNLQLRGIRIEDIPSIFKRLEELGMTSMQSGMDNVRNLTGSPVAGIDADELFDTRELNQQVQDMITNSGQGNKNFTNLPRKFNIAIEGGRDNSIHAEINDVAFVPAFKDGNFGFNVVVGGFFSATRCEAAIPLNAWVTPDNAVVELCRVILEVFRDNGSRKVRQKSRLMWLIDDWGMEKFRASLEEKLGHPLQTAAEKDEMDWDKRTHIGLHKQKQAGLNYAGLVVPAGRFQADDMFELARLAEVYGDGDIRLTVEQNAIIANIPDSRLEAFQQESLLQKFPLVATPLVGSVVSCTGAQFCKFAIVETKQRAIQIAQEVEAEMDIPQSVRMHWTGCPNSCGQPQVAEIGFMGTKTRKNGKSVEAVDIFMGGKIGKDAHLGEKVMKGIPCEDLKPVLRQLLVEQFNAKLKEGVVIDDGPSEAEEAAAGEMVKVSFNQTVQADSSKSLLEIAEEAGVAIESSCKSGSCGTCKHKLAKGEVTYDGDPDALSEEEKKEGYVLTCIAYPKGEVALEL